MGSQKIKPPGTIALDSELIREARALLKEHPEGMESEALALALFKMQAVPAALARRMLNGLFQSDLQFVFDRGRWFLQTLSFDWEQPLASADFVVLDVEVIGRGRSAKIVELAGFKLNTTGILNEFYSLVNPGRPLSPGWWKAPRFSQKELESAPKIEQVLDAFFQFAGGAIWVAHNARFDLRVLNLELRRLTHFQIARPVLDTLPLVRRYFPDLDGHNLPQLANFFGVELEEHHRAHSDAAALSKIFLKILRKLENEGHASLTALRPFALPSGWEELGKR